MKLTEAMSRDVQIASSGQTAQAAVQPMADIDAGVLPVGENDQLVGMLTDRDDDDDADEVCSSMKQQIRRRPAVKCEMRLVGILSLGDLAARDGGQRFGAGRFRHLAAGRPIPAAPLTADER